MGRKKALSVFQAHLPFKSRIPARGVAIPLHLEKKALVMLSALLIISAVLYSYFVMLSVSHVVIREEIMHETEKLASDVAKLESQYLARSVTITEETALAHGFKRGGKQTFVERGAVTLSNAR